MSENYYFCKDKLTFYPESMIDDYADVDIDNLTLIDGVTHQHIINQSGVLLADKQGYPMVIPHRPSEFHELNQDTLEWLLPENKREDFMKAEIKQLVELQRGFISRYLDSKAKAFGYDSLVVAISYADEPAVPKFQKEGLAFRRWRSEVWEVVHQYFDDLDKGEPAISNDELLERLPTLVIDDI